MSTFIYECPQCNGMILAASPSFFCPMCGVLYEWKSINSIPKISDPEELVAHLEEHRNHPVEIDNFELEQHMVNNLMIAEIVKHQKNMLQKIVGENYDVDDAPTKDITDKFYQQISDHYDDRRYHIIRNYECSN